MVAIIHTIVAAAVFAAGPKGLTARLRTGNGFYAPRLWPDAANPNHFEASVKS